MPPIARAFILAIALLTCRPAAALDIFVAPGGRDNGTGTQAQPFATLERARSAIRELKAAGPLREPVNVRIRGGIYTLPQGFKLETADSGTAGAPVTWRAWHDEKPILAGGRTIGGFVPYRGQILKADLAQQGFKGIAFSQLVFNGRRMTLARYPNFDARNPYGGGWAYTDGKLVPMYGEVPGEDRHSFTCKAQDLRSWAHPEEVRVFVFARYNWWNNICRIKAMDPATRRIVLAQDASYAIRPGDRYYFQNALEELDAPGEWYLDRRTWTLYFWPPAPLADKAVMAPTTRTVVEFAPGTAYVTLRGLTIECAEGNAVELRETQSCRVAGCTIRNVGDYNGSGVVIGGGANNGVLGCDIHDIGSHGVSLSGGDRIKLTPAGNVADNNYIHHIGAVYKQGVGISLTGVGNRASHNLIHDGPRMGIMFGGNNLIIEYNEIRHMNLETEDTGAIYTGGRDWLGSRGTVIRYNYFHDMFGYGHDAKGIWHSPYFAWGVYLDDNTGGVDVIGNVVVRCPRAAIHLHNGRDNHVENNIFAESVMQQMECSGWTRTHRYWTGHLPTMIQGYESVMHEPAWRAMRGMNVHPKDAVLSSGLIMTGNEFARNIIYWHDPKAKYVSFKNFPFDHNACDSNILWNFGQPIQTGRNGGGKGVSGTSKAAPIADEWAAWQALGMDRHSQVADPLFVNAAANDWRLKPASPAFKLGFRPIPMDQIGPYRDELRATWPIVQAEGAREKPLTP